MMEKVLDWLYGVLVSPSEVFRRLSEEQPVRPAGLLLLLLAVLTSAAGPFDVTEEFLGIEIPRVWMFLGSAIGTFVGSVALMGAVFAVSAVFGGTGGFAGMFSAVAFAQFPAMFGVPAGLLSRVPGAAAIGGLLSFGVGMWTFILSVIALRESRELSTGMSVLSYVTAALAFIIVVAVMVVVALLPML